MDSAFNDIDFLMGNIKQETTNSNEHAVPLTDSAPQNNDTEQFAMSMSDFILDYINRTLKNEEEETQQENNTTDRENEEESVEDLLERAESMIRENMQQSNEPNVQEENTHAAVNYGWMPTLNAQQGSSLNSVPNDPGHSSTIPILGHASASDPHVIAVANDEVSDIISVDTDSDDEVIFVNSHQPSTVIPVIDLSDHSSPSDTNIQPTSKRHDTMKRTYNSPEFFADSPAPVPVEKHFRHSCAVCLEDVKGPHSTTCGHIYCGDCIKNAIKIFKKCPTCNKKLKISNVHPIYL